MYRTLLSLILILPFLLSSCNSYQSASNPVFGKSNRKYKEVKLNQITFNHKKTLEEYSRSVQDEHVAALTKKVVLTKVENNKAEVFKQDNNETVSTSKEFSNPLLGLSFDRQLIFPNYSKKNQATTEEITPLKKTNGLAIASLICAIIGIFFAGVILGILAIVFGAVAISQITQLPDVYTGKTCAILGIIFGFIALVGALYVISTL